MFILKAKQYNLWKNQNNSKTENNRNLIAEKWQSYTITHQNIKNKTITMDPISNHSNQTSQSIETFNYQVTNRPVWIIKLQSLENPLRRVSLLKSDTI